MNDLPVGTLCYLINASPGQEHLNGRSVEIIALPRPMPERGLGLFYEIHAPWLVTEMPRHRYFAARHQLRPIAPPPPSLHERDCEPAQA